MFSYIPHIGSEAVTSIEAMYMQEQTAYQTEDYLPQLQGVESLLTSSDVLPQQHQPVDKECRSKMAEWCFLVVDFCGFNRDTVSIAMNCLDRFLMTPSGQEAIMDRKIFQLAAMTSLYTAVKVHESKAIEPKVIASLSRGSFTEAEVTDMERRMLLAIQWQINPPTAMSFVHHFVTLLEKGSMEDSDMIGVLAFAEFQTELAVSTHTFAGIGASTVAFAALSNALQYTNIKHGVKNNFLTAIAKVINVNVASAFILKVQAQLHGAVQNASTVECGGQKLRPIASSKGLCNRNRSVHSSPRGVCSTK